MDDEQLEGSDFTLQALDTIIRNVYKVNYFQASFSVELVENF